MRSPTSTVIFSTSFCFFTPSHIVSQRQSLHAQKPNMNIYKGVSNYGTLFCNIKAAKSRKSFLQIRNR